MITKHIPITIKFTNVINNNNDENGNGKSFLINDRTSNICTYNGKLLDNNNYNQSKSLSEYLSQDKGGAELSEYLSQQSKFLEYIHPYFESDNFNYNPFDLFDWSLTEFSPLISNPCECDGTIQPLSETFLDEYGNFYY